MEEKFCRNGGMPLTREPMIDADICKKAEEVLARCEDATTIIS